MSAIYSGKPEVGRFVGAENRYELIGHHDSGAMGDVWKAHDHNLGRIVAVKFLALDRQVGAFLSGERVKIMRDLFDRESRTMAQVASPYVATIHDRDMGGEAPFLVLEYIEGRRLADYMGDGTPLRLEQTVRWSRQIAEGLAAAHQQDVVHRDIKPGNILITDDNSDVRIIDFGIARFADATESHSGSGTPLYASPERCRHESGDARSDLYSLGCVMYEMVTGFTPFGDSRSDYGALAHAHQKKQPSRPSAQVSGVPGPLDNLIMSLLAKSPLDRPRNARVVISAVHEVERTPEVTDQARRSGDGRVERGAPHVNTGFVGRIRETERRVWQLTAKYGETHTEVFTARTELADLTGESGDERGAAELFERLGRDGAQWFGRHDRRTLDAYEGMIRWIEGQDRP